MRLRKLTAFALWAAVSLVVMTLITLPISLQTHLIAGAAVVAAMMILKAVAAARHLAADRARARNFDRPSLRLLAHHQYAAADQSASKLSARTARLSRRNV